MKTTILTFATVSLVATQAAQAEVCMSPDEMHAALVDWYAEAPVEAVSEVNGTDTQLWTSAKNDTWTLVQYVSSLSACVAAQGVDVRTAPRANRVVAALTASD